MIDPNNFFKEAKLLFQFYGEGRFDDALAIAEELATEYPSFSVKTYYWRICLLSVTGRQAEALRIFEEALTHEIWWAEGQLRSDSDLHSLQGNQEFENLILLSNQKTKKAQEDAKPEIFTYLPNASGPFPLLVALHARGSSPQLDSHFWQPAVEHGWMLAMPQSSQLAAPLSFLWDNREKALSEIVEHIKSLIENHSVDTKQIIIAGFSQGAARSMQLVMKELIETRGFLAVAPGGIELDEFDSWTNLNNLRAVLVAGGKDPRYEFIQQIKIKLEEKKFPLMFKNYPKLGHEFPDDFDELLQKGLQFILKKETE